jgi:hypothetical protein
MENENERKNAFSPSCKSQKTLEFLFIFGVSLWLCAKGVPLGSGYRGHGIASTRESAGISGCKGMAPHHTEQALNKNTIESAIIYHISQLTGEGQADT